MLSKNFTFEFSIFSFDCIPSGSATWLYTSASILAVCLLVYLLVCPLAVSTKGYKYLLQAPVSFFTSSCPSYPSLDVILLSSAFLPFKSFFFCIEENRQEDRQKIIIMLYTYYIIYFVCISPDKRIINANISQNTRLHCFMFLRDVEPTSAAHCSSMCGCHQWLW